MTNANQNHNHDPQISHLPSQEQPQPSPQTLAASLVTRCKLLLAEIDALQTLLTQTQRNPQVVEVRSMRSNVLSELKTLEKLAERVDVAVAAGVAGEDDEAHLRLGHALRSSNLPFYETVWTIAKRTCTGLVAFGKRFYWEGGAEVVDEEAAKTKNKKLPNKDKRRSVFVDIVADDGEEWVKVSTISETRLLFEMAKKGWEGESDAGSEEGVGRTVLQNYIGDGPGSDDEDDNDDEIELVKLARDMRKAANCSRVRYRHPRLRFVIPKIAEGESSEIDDLLKVIRSYGVVVDCGEERLGSSSKDKELVQPASAPEDDLRQLLPTQFKRFTPTVNVDCTLLLAMVSDLSHFKNIPPSPALHKAIIRQLEVEGQRPLLATELWPAMGAHELVCTEEAAKRMREIVEVIGTDDEKKRTEILMANPPPNGCDAKSSVERLQELSDYQIPPNWQIPIKIVDAMPVIRSAKENGRLPAVSHQMTEILSDINYSVFMYGWAAGMMTISSNRTVVKQIEATVETHRNGDENLEGPLIWVCDTARSLVGKEKGRKN